MSNSVYRRDIINTVKHANHIVNDYTNKILTPYNMRKMIARLKKIGVTIDDNCVESKCEDGKRISIFNYFYERHTNKINSVIGSQFIQIEYINEDSGKNTYIYYFS